MRRVQSGQTSLPWKGRAEVVRKSPGAWRKRAETYLPLFLTVQNLGARGTFSEGACSAVKLRPMGHCAPKEHMGSNSTKLMPQKTISVV